MDVGGWKLEMASDTDQSLITNLSTKKGPSTLGQPLELARRYGQAAGSMDTGVRRAGRIRIATRMLIMATQDSAITVAASISNRYQV